MISVDEYRGIFKRLAQIAEECTVVIGTEEVNREVFHHRNFLLKLKEEAANGRPPAP